MAENTNLSQSQRLIAEKKKQEDQGNMQAFNAIVVDVGIPTRKHFPSLKGTDGKTILDERGYAKKSEESDGYSVTLAVFGRQQFVHLVFQKPVNLKPATAYRASGFGYDLGQNFYIKQDPHLSNY